MRKALLEVWANPYVRVGVLLLGLLAAYLLLARTTAVWVGFLIAYTLAYLVDPLLRRLQRHGVGRAFGVLLVYALFFLFAGLASVLLVEVVAQLSQLSERIPQALKPLDGWIDRLPAVLRRWAEAPEVQAVLVYTTDGLKALLQGFSDLLVSWLGALLSQGGNLIAGLAALAGGLLQLFVVFVITGYLMVDFPRINAALSEALPRPWQPLALELAGKLDRAVGGYIRGQLLVAALVGLVVGLGLWLSGVPMAAALGFIAGVFNLVPYLGVVVSIVPAVLLALTVAFWKVLAVLVVFAVANQLEANLFSPFILGRATELHPVTVVLAILAGASLFGLWGAMLAVPVVAFAKVLYTDYYLPSRCHEQGC
ncbi:MAG TPA: AI-2E family transporter [Oceanithermus profundus]|uniref:AI-2E family transporter n=1 Tax=Oceanithermus profundus TaxID=187137 RepID=A0A7C4ZFI6_9DEIN|nr:AI-2E family transporter [Oceanithermus profundus]